jgi:hypothetical protein
MSGLAMFTELGDTEYFLIAGMVPADRTSNEDA